MKVRVVIGSNYGDEGKGTVTANYASKVKGKCLNVLTNGGPQRGHSVVTPFAEHTFKHFGSGTFFGADTYYSSYFICNPMQFVIEYEELQQKYDISKTNIYRSPNCRWTTPWDMMANQIKEISRKDNRHGSCGMGIWNTIARSAVFRFFENSKSITIDKFSKMSLENKILYLRSIKAYYKDIISLKAFELYKDAWFSEETVLHYIRDVEFFCNHTKIMYSINEYDYDEVIFENGQGLLLSDNKMNVHTTPTNTGCNYAARIIHELNNIESVDLHYVTRAYLTRHGNGNLENEQKRSCISSGVKEDRTNHFNEWQGDFRYGKLNLPDLEARLNKDIKECSFILPEFSLKDILKVNVEVTHLDELDCLNDINKRFEKNHWNINSYDNPIVR